jgi:hypothetical protein
VRRALRAHHIFQSASVVARAQTLALLTRMRNLIGLRTSRTPDPRAALRASAHCGWLGSPDSAARRPVGRQGPLSC